MSYQVKIIFLPEPPLPCALHLPLELDDILAQDEPSLKEAHENPRRDGHEVLAAPGIAHENSAVFSGLEDAHALLCDLLHLLCELGYVMNARYVALAVMGIGDDAGIGRVGGDEVDGFRLDQVK